MDSRIVIIGAGLAGGSVAALLRQHGFSGTITLIGDELVPPYQRPPLSKSFLQGIRGVDMLKLKSDNFYAQNRIAVRLGTCVEYIDRTQGCVRLSTGHAESYDYVVLATGSLNRQLNIPGSALPGVYGLRSIVDAQKLKAAMERSRNVVIVGGGYIGLEVAASACEMGLGVTVLERATRILSRVASEPLSVFFARYHRDRSVGIVTGADVVACAASSSGSIEAIFLADGRRFPCELALIGIGTVPRDRLAREAGLACGDGVLVDGNARTSDSRIFAVGDVTARPLAHFENRSVRLESVANAVEQARQAAAAIMGQTAPRPEVPWFWSDQFDLKLQIAGLAFETDMTALRGDPERSGFAVFHLQQDRVRAVEAVNAAPEFMVGRQLIASRDRVRADWIADPTRSLKQIRI